MGRKNEVYDLNMLHLALGRRHIRPDNRLQVLVVLTGGPEFWLLLEELLLSLLLIELLLLLLWLEDVFDLLHGP